MKKAITKRSDHQCISPSYIDLANDREENIPIKRSDLIVGESVFISQPRRATYF